jgi:hypothetical protein
MLLCALGLSHCAKNKPQPERTEPWPAVPSALASAKLPTQSVNYEVVAPSRVWFELGSRTPKIKGEVAAVSGNISLNFSNAADSRATINTDLSALRILSDSDASDVENTTEALNWLGLGQGQSPEVRERLRVSTFTLKFVDTNGVSLGSLLAHETDATAKTTRRANFTIKGDLLLHGYRVPAQADVELEFAPVPLGSTTPDRLTIRSRRPLFISFETHDLKPRDDSGTLVAKDLKNASSRVGRDARLHFELQARVFSGQASEKKH